MSTIYALASGAVPSGVAIIRMSGPNVSHAIKTLTSNKTLPRPRNLSLRTTQGIFQCQQLYFANRMGND